MASLGRGAHRYYRSITNAKIAEARRVRDWGEANILDTPKPEHTGPSLWKRMKTVARTIYRYLPWVYVPYRWKVARMYRLGQDFRSLAVARRMDEWVKP